MKASSATPLVVVPLALTALLFSASAIAGPVCTQVPRKQWLPEAAVKQKILAAGYTIKEFKVSGTCYEIYGKNARGNKVEIYFDPTDGRIVKRRGS